MVVEMAYCAQNFNNKSIFTEVCPTYNTYIKSIYISSSLSLSLSEMYKAYTSYHLYILIIHFLFQYCGFTQGQ